MQCVVDRYNSTLGFPEMIQLIQEDLLCISIDDIPGLYKEAFTNISNALLEALVPVTTASTRKPLRWRVQGLKLISSLTPSYDVNYAYSKTNAKAGSKEREKIQERVLSKQLKRESKAVMRELRRDADYIDSEKFIASTKKQNALQAERHKNYAVLENEQGEINTQVKIGKGDLIKGGGSSGVGARKPRINRF